MLRFCFSLAYSSHAADTVRYQEVFYRSKLDQGNNPEPCSVHVPMGEPATLLLLQQLENNSTDVPQHIQHI